MSKVKYAVPVCPMGLGAWNTLDAGDVIATSKRSFVVKSVEFKGYGKPNTVFLETQDGKEFGTADHYWYRIVTKNAPNFPTPVPPQEDKPYDHKQGIPVPAPLAREIAAELAGTPIGERLQSLIADYEAERKALVAARFGGQD